MSLTLWVVKLTPVKRISQCHADGQEQEEIPSFFNSTLLPLIGILFIIINIGFS